MKKNIQEIAYELQNRFLDENFVVQRYDSYSTKSIYLKLDYGVAKSIRISDHKGYSRLSYRYNVRLDIDKSYKETDKQGFLRYYFSPNDLDKLVNHILDLRKKQIDSIGEFKYSLKVTQYLEANSGSKGFWQKCKKIIRRREDDIR